MSRKEYLRPETADLTEVEGIKYPNDEEGFATGDEDLFDEELE